MREIYVGPWKNSGYKHLHILSRPDQLDNPSTIMNTPSTYELQYVGLCREVDGVNCTITRSIHPELIGILVVLEDISFRKLIDAGCIHFGKMVGNFQFIHKGKIKLSLKE